MIGDRHMAAHDNVVGDDDVAAELAVMRNVRHRHQQTIRSDPCDATAGHCAAMDGAVLAHLRAWADLAACRLTPVFQILRWQPDAAKGVENRASTDPRVPVDDDMRDQPRAILDHHISADRAEWTDFDIGAEIGTLSDNGGWMNRRSLGWPELSERQVVG
jgi:hypothetical protein